MLQKMQQDVLNLAARTLDLFDVTQSTDVARFIKTVTIWMNLGLQSSKKNMFDRVCGHGWQCIVGTEHGSFVTHSHGMLHLLWNRQSRNVAFQGCGESADEANLILALETINA
ncbi:Dynein light chain [Citrus sinensis]|uniref:Dynein light chain n=1 Tax=Citrus sinensis TaxID=2711 RepID=A0ACB8NFU4_CITSI|nr:Dynein light chain [Citrus sinensis]